MTNILNTLKTPNTNVLPARKLTKEGKRNIQVNHIPQQMYRYSINDALKAREQQRLQIEKDIYKNRIKKRKKDKTFPLILGLVCATFLLLKKKFIK
jgi:hypothetical protein